jgi:hypothetical protein
MSHTDQVMELLDHYCEGNVIFVEEARETEI